MELQSYRVSRARAVVAGDRRGTLSDKIPLPLDTLLYAPREGCRESNHSTTSPPAAGATQVHHLSDEDLADADGGGALA